MKTYKAKILKWIMSPGRDMSKPLVMSIAYAKSWNDTKQKHLQLRFLRES